VGVDVPPAGTVVAKEEVQVPESGDENMPVVALEITVTVTGLLDACGICTNIGADCTPAVIVCGAVPNERPGCVVHRTSPSKPPDAYCASATGPIEGPTPPHFDWAFASDPAPGTQLGYETKVDVFPVMVCQLDEPA
jgi:hypothetical protein